MQVPTLSKLLEAGAHFGHKKELSHPGANDYIFTTRNGINVIDLEKTVDQFKDIKKVLEKLKKDGKNILFVGTKKQAKEAVRELANEAKMPYVDYRWLGGTLTNFSTIKARIKKYNDLRKSIESGDFKKLIKKEQSMMKKEKERMSKFFEGLKDLDKIPDALFVFDPVEEHVAIAEAKVMKLPVVVLANTNANIRDYENVIVANDNSKKVVDLITEFIKDIFKDSSKKK